MFEAALQFLSFSHAGMPKRVLSIACKLVYYSRKRIDMISWKKGAGGAVLGASSGYQLGGAFGAALGGIVGGLGGLFGGRTASSRYTKQLTRQNRRLSAYLQGLHTRAKHTPAVQTNVYQQGMAAARDQAVQQADLDAAQAAALGLSGTEYEMAQASERTKALAQVQRALLAEGEQEQQEEQRRLLQAWLSQQRTSNALATGRQRLAAQQARVEDRLLFNALLQAGRLRSHRN